MSAPVKASKGAAAPPQTAEESWAKRFIQAMLSPATGTIVRAVLLALLIGAVIVAAFDPKVQTTAGYLLARPSDFFVATLESFSGFFTSLIRGAIFDWTQPTFAGSIKPITDTMLRATPLIIAGLAIAVSFTAGLFNIGVQGQLLMGAVFGGFVGFAVELPYGVHLLVAIIGAIVGGALWGLIPGILKAKLGANEVIVTIMLNSVALYLLQYMLTTRIFVGEGGYPGKSQKILPTAELPLLLGENFRLHAGFVLALLAAVFTAWLLKRSTFGFELRAAGANQNAARTAGINVPRTLMLTLLLSGALAGLAGTAPVLGTEKFISAGVAASYGFDAITVALLGKSRPMGVVLAGLLFGALNAGSAVMQSVDIPVDIVQITQAVIVLLIAASEANRLRKTQRALQAQVVKAATTEGKKA